MHGGVRSGIRNLIPDPIGHTRQPFRGRFGVAWERVLLQSGVTIYQASGPSTMKKAALRAATRSRQVVLNNHERTVTARPRNYKTA